MHLEESSKPGTGNGSRLAAGLAVSLLAHALLVLAYRADRPPHDFSLDNSDEPLAVWIQPPPRPVPEPEPAVPKRPTKPAVRRASGSHSLHRIIAVEPAAPSEPARTVVQPVEPAAHFDMDAARLAARDMADEPVLTAQGRVRERRIAAETKLARDIERADRRDCKDGIPGGLLAPLYLLMDKKDHGCKW